MYALGMVLISILTSPSLKDEEPAKANFPLKLINLFLFIHLLQTDASSLKDQTVRRKLLQISLIYHIKLNSMEEK